VEAPAGDVDWAASAFRIGDCPVDYRQVPEPHVRVRLKHAGRHEEGQIVTAVRNGEGGAAAGVEARNEESGATGDGHQHILSGVRCRRSPRYAARRGACPTDGDGPGNAAVRNPIAGASFDADAGGREVGSSEPAAWTFADATNADGHR
jgi:hypothetical protein